MHITAINNKCNCYYNHWMWWMFILGGNTRGIEGTLSSCCSSTAAFVRPWWCKTSGPGWDDETVGRTVLIPNHWVSLGCARPIFVVLNQVQKLSNGQTLSKFQSMQHKTLLFLFWWNIKTTLIPKKPSQNITDIVVFVQICWCQRPSCSFPKTLSSL